jgi:hypothetical protein
MSVFFNSPQENKRTQLKLKPKIYNLMWFRNQNCQAAVGKPLISGSRGSWISEFKAILVYLESSKIAGAITHTHTHTHTCLKQTNKQTNKRDEAQRDPLAFVYQMLESQARPLSPFYMWEIAHWPAFLGFS